MLEPFLAEIALCSFAFPPKGWAFCHGQLLPIQQNQALFAILGTTYGGDGRTNFALPDLRGRSPAHVGDDLFLGMRTGAETHTLTANELPAHTHGLQGLSDVANTTTPVNSLPAAKGRGGRDIYASSGPTQELHPQAIGVTGQGQPHENMQPFLTLNFIIALQGVFPSQN